MLFVYNGLLFVDNNHVLSFTFLIKSNLVV